jgi:hypothetical protein
MRRILPYLVALLAVVTVGWSGLVAYWLYYPYVPIVVDPIKIMNKDKRVMQGGTLIYHLKWDKRMDVTGELTRKLVNTFNLDLRASKTTAPVGKDQACVPIEIPLRADPGQYQLSWSVEYQVNPIRKVTVAVLSEPFEVLADHREINELKSMMKTQREATVKMKRWQDVPASR